MALTMTAVLANIRDDVEEGLRSILTNIAREHNLNEKELLVKYLYKDIPDLSPASTVLYQPHPPTNPKPKYIYEEVVFTTKEPQAQAPKKKGGGSPSSRISQTSKPQPNSQTNSWTN